METREIFERRARMADERAAEATHPIERKIWTDIAAEYRVFAKQVAADLPLMRLGEVKR